MYACHAPIYCICPLSLLGPHLKWSFDYGCLAALFLPNFIFFLTYRSLAVRGCHLYAFKCLFVLYMGGKWHKLFSFGLCNCIFFVNEFFGRPPVSPGNIDEVRKDPVSLASCRNTATVVGLCLRTVTHLQLFVISGFFHLASADRYWLCSDWIGADVSAIHVYRCRPVDRT